ncbi:dipeptidase [Puniceicoccaceae bacterium K14]|nr:dipeptidase [Puniceicoccaceae bacterium K14]
MNSLSKTLLAGFVFASINVTFADPHPKTPRTDCTEVALKELAWKIHDNSLTIDTHMDVPIVLRRPGFDISKEHSWYGHASQVDFPRLRKGGLDGGFFVVYVPQGELTYEGRKHAISEGKKITQLILDTVAKNSDESGLATTEAEAEALRKEGKITVFMGIENGYTIGRNLDLLKTYYDMGVRYFGVTHSKNNDLADSSTDSKGNLHMGLSDLGKAAIDECNRLGMMIDISHSSDKTTWDILKYSKAPVIASHSGCHSCHPHPRSLNDSLLKEIAARGGVVQMNLFSSYMMKTEPNEERSKAFKAWFENYRNGKELTDGEKLQSVEERIAIEKNHPKQLTTLEAAVDHIDHMVDVMGIDHIGISGDFDGGGGVKGANDVGEMMNITIEMLRRGYSADDMKKFWGGNVMRVLNECEKVALEMAPKEDDQNEDKT